MLSDIFVEKWNKLDKEGSKVKSVWINNIYMNVDKFYITINRKFNNIVAYLYRDGNTITMVDIEQITDLKTEERGY